MDLLPIAQLALLFLLLVLSALISGAEVAFFSLNNSDLDEKELTKGDTLNIIKYLLNRRKRLLATILITNNFINIAIVLIFASFRNFLFEGLFSPVINLLIEIGVITIIILLFGEILPKIYANRNPLGFAKFMSRPLKFLDSYILFFLTFPMSKMTYFFENRLDKKNDEFSVDQLSQALELTDEHETTKEEQKILQGIVNFGNIDTKEVMCPRIDVFAISTEESLKEILPKIMENGFSRIPVYREHLDKVEGILYIKDLLPHLKNFEFDFSKST